MPNVNYVGYEAAHIFPLNEMDHVGYYFSFAAASLLQFLYQWNENNFKRYIEDDQVEPGKEINSVQQGFLCLATHHRFFDDYEIGIDPDVGYLTTCISVNDVEAL